jgi:hypothetical protein
MAPPTMAKSTISSSNDAFIYWDSEQWIDIAPTLAGAPITLIYALK